MPTFTLSMHASIFSCSTAFLAWEMLVVLLLDTPSFILRPWNRAQGLGCCSSGVRRALCARPRPQHRQLLHPAGARGSTPPPPRGKEKQCATSHQSAHASAGKTVSLRLARAGRRSQRPQAAPLPLVTLQRFPRDQSFPHTWGRSVLQRLMRLARRRDIQPAVRGPAARLGTQPDSEPGPSPGLSLWSCAASPAIGASSTRPGDKNPSLRS